MNICLISVVTYRHGINGGMEVHGRLLAKGLAARGHAVTIITSRHPSGLATERSEGVEIHYLQETGFASQKGNWAAECGSSFRALHERKAFDVLCCQHTVAPPAVMRFAQHQNIPVVVIIEGLAGWVFLSEVRQAFSHHKGYGQLGRRLLSFLYYYLSWEVPVARKCDALIAVSDEVARSIPAWCGVRADKVCTVYNGVDVGAFAPDSSMRETMRKQYGISPDDRLIIFLSHVTRQKGLHLLLTCLPDVLAQHGRTKLLVAGEGDYLSEAKGLVDTMGLRSHVIFTGHVPHERSADYLNAADLYVLPTLRQEGLPFSLVEAMACQKPVVASRIGGIPSVVRHEINGLMVQPGDPDSLGQAIVRVLADTELAASLSRKARETVVAGYSLESMVQGTLKVFETVLGKKRSALHSRQETHASP
jgi:glycosyltransferase involved in cell wall biosynthesis